MTVTCLGVTIDPKLGRVLIRWDDGSSDEYLSLSGLIAGLAELDTDDFLPTLKRLALQAALSSSPQKNSFASVVNQPAVWDSAAMALSVKAG